MMMEDLNDSIGRPSLYVVLSPKDDRSAHLCSILQLESKPNSHVDASAAPELRPVQLDEEKAYEVGFNIPELPADKKTTPRINWLYSLTKDEELLMVPFMSSDAYQIDVPPLTGIKYNFRTKRHRKIKPAYSFKPNVGCAVNLGGFIYFITHPCGLLTPQPIPCIQRYDPVGDFWQTLAPFPRPSNTDIKATAVWYDNILFNMVGCHSEIWAYNVTLNTWYPVSVPHELCYFIIGEAVVVENTIYALKDNSYDSVLALSIQRVDNNGETLYICSLVCEFSVPGMRCISSLCGTRHLVHLGQGNFCIVQSCELFCGPVVNQPVLVTYLKLEANNSMIVTDNCLYEYPVEGALQLQFRAALCFCLPEYKAPPAFDIYFFSPFPWDYHMKLFDTEYFKFRYAEESGLIYDLTDTWTPEIHPQHVVSKKSSASLVSAKSNVYASKGSTISSKASTPECGRLTSKRLKTVGEDFEQGRGSKTVYATDSSTPEKSSASGRGKTVEEVCGRKPWRGIVKKKVTKCN